MTLAPAYLPRRPAVLWGRNKDMPAVHLFLELVSTAAADACRFEIVNILDVVYKELHELGQYQAVVLLPYAPGI